MGRGLWDLGDRRGSKYRPDREGSWREEKRARTQMSGEPGSRVPDCPRREKWRAGWRMVGGGKFEVSRLEAQRPARAPPPQTTPSPLPPLLNPLQTLPLLNPRRPSGLKILPLTPAPTAPSLLPRGLHHHQGALEAQCPGSRPPPQGTQFLGLSPWVLSCSPTSSNTPGQLKPLRLGVEPWVYAGGVP